MKPNPNNLIWLDLEMTGLNPARDRIIEIAVVITDGQLNVIAEGPALAIHQPDDLMKSMDHWCTRTHTGSGLVDRVAISKLDEAHAEAQVLEFIMAHVPPGKSPLCGNSVHQDRRFMNKYMPKLEQYFHYRHLDVSTVKILAQRWAPNVSKGLTKQVQHLALSDIYDSIDELKYYRKEIMKV